MINCKTEINLETSPSGICAVQSRTGIGILWLLWFFLLVSSHHCSMHIN